MPHNWECSCENWRIRLLWHVSSSRWDSSIHSPFTLKMEPNMYVRHQSKVCDLTTQFSQLQVLEALTKLKGRNRLAEDAILRLNSSLLEITQVCHNCQHLSVLFALPCKEIFTPPYSLYYLMVFPACLLLYWKWRQYVPLKHQHISTRPCSLTCHRAYLITTRLLKLLLCCLAVLMCGLKQENL